MICARCTSIVRGLSPRWAAASLLDEALAISASTSRSRCVNRRQPGKSVAMMGAAASCCCRRLQASMISRRRAGSASGSNGFWTTSKAPIFVASTARGGGSGGHDDDRRGIVWGIEVSQNVKSRPARHVDIEKNTGRRPRPRHRGEGLIVAEAGHAITVGLQRAGDEIAQAGIIIEDENLVTVRHLGRLPSGFGWHRLSIGIYIYDNYL